MNDFIYYNVGKALCHLNKTYTVVIDVYIPIFKLIQTHANSQHKQIDGMTRCNRNIITST